MNRTIFWILVVFLQFGNMSTAQNNSNDSLATFSASQLEQKFYNTLSKDKSLSRLFALQYLKKAKQINNNLNVSKGYYFVVKSSSRSEMLIYSDSLIQHTNRYPKGHYSGIAHYLIGTESYLKNNKVEALNQFMIADSILAVTDSVVEKYWVKQMIGMLKLNSKDYAGALKEYSKSLRYYEKIQDWESYSSNAFSIYVLLLEEK